MFKFKKLQNEILKYLWQRLASYKWGNYILIVLSSISYLPLFFLKKIMRSNWFVQKNLCLALIGKGELDKSINYLKEIEDTENYNNEEIKILYLALSHYCFRHNKLENIINLFEVRSYNNPNEIWAWRILIDLNYYLCRFEKVKIHHESYLKNIQDYASKKKYSIERKYFGTYFTSSIGHTCLLADHVISKSICSNKNKDVLFVKKANVANSVLLSYLYPFYDVIFDEENKISENEIERIQDPFAYQFNHGNSWFDLYDIRADLYKTWYKLHHKPLLTLLKEDIEYGWLYLKKFGINENNWFVVLHVRYAQGGSLRNANILNYSKAIDKIIEKGGWVIRIGDNKMPLLKGRKNFIDLTKSKNKSERLDIFLIGNCKFVISSTSGPANVPILFGKKSIQTNLIPLRHSVPNSEDIVIPSILYSNSKNRLLTFREIFKSDLSYSETAKSYKENIIKFENTEIEIMNACIEMMKIVIDNIKLEPSELQIKFKLMCKEMRIQFEPNISQYFLEKHSNLI